MVKSCCAFGCCERFVKGGKVTFHRFPKDVQRRKEWTNAIRRVNFTPADHSFVCSKHFSDDSFDTQKFGGVRWLKKNAVPTNFDFPSHMQTCKALRKSPTKRTIPDTNVTSEASTSSCTASAHPPQIAQDTPHMKQKVYRYVGDFPEDNMTSPTNIAKRWSVAREHIKRQRRRIKTLTEKKRRLHKRVVSLKAVLSHLKEKSLITECAGDKLELALPEAASQLIQRAGKGSTREKYPPELRSFALTLHFYSAKAYNYVRKTFNTSLPHPTTLRKWYQVVDGKPGFTKEALNALKIKVAEASSVNKPVLCALMMDEVAIRKHVEWDGKKFCGYVDMGTELNDDQLPVAREALTFMVNCINGHWKVPIGYFLIDGLSGTERANLVNESLLFIHETGVEVVSLTFDGASANINMANGLGANLDPINLNPTFKHPVTGSDIFILLDACHMLKLVRNTLASKGSMVDMNGGLIKWEYIEKLEQFQSDEGLTAATKLRKRHIQWYREKMKVKVAAQTLSNSVASALEYLNKDLNLPQFAGCQPTVDFIRRFNDLFDILNSRNLLSKGFKSPMKLQNERSFSTFLSETETYITELKTHHNGIPIIKTNGKTGFLGFIICIQSVSGLFHTLVKGNNPKLKFILTYKLSQDHLEVFFSAIRSKGGFNNNPTARQFEATYKRLLVHHELVSSKNANCLAIDSTCILHVSSGLNQDGEQFNKNNPYVLQLNALLDRNMCNDSQALITTCRSFVGHDHSYSNLQIRSPHELSAYTTDVVGYIAGFVKRKLSRVINCEECCAAIESNNSTCLLLNRKNKGGLSVASSDVILLCRAAEKSFRVAQASGKLQYKNIQSLLILSAMKAMPKGVFDCLREHIIDQEPIDNHRSNLIKSVMCEYLKIRLHHVGRSITQELQSQKIRSINAKLTLFKGH